MGQSTPHARTPNDVIRDPMISVQAKALYTLLASYTGVENTCFPAIATMSKDLKTSENWVRRYLKELVDIKLVELIHRNGKSTLYKLLQTPATGGTPHTSVTPTTGSTPATGEYQPLPLVGAYQVHEQVKRMGSLRARQKPPPNEPQDFETWPPPEQPVSPSNPQVTPPDDEAVKGWAAMVGIPPDEAVDIAEFFRATEWYDIHDNPIRNWQAKIKSSYTLTKKKGKRGNNGTRQQNPTRITDGHEQLAELRKRIEHEESKASVNGNLALKAHPFDTTE